EFKIAAVKQVTEGGHSIADVAKRLGITTKSLYNWRDRYGDNANAYQEKQSFNDELRKLKAELKRVTEERDILKEAAGLKAVVSTAIERSTKTCSRWENVVARTACIASCEPQRFNLSAVINARRITLVVTYPRWRRIYSTVSSR